MGGNEGVNLKRRLLYDPPVSSYHHDWRERQGNARGEKKPTLDAGCEKGKEFIPKDWQR